MSNTGVRRHRRRPVTRPGVRRSRPCRKGRKASMRHVRRVVRQGYVLVDLGQEKWTERAFRHRGWQAARGMCVGVRHSTRGHGHRHTHKHREKKKKERHTLDVWNARHDR